MRPRVAVSKGMTVEERFLSGLDLLGGIDKIIAKGDSVLLKPNMVGHASPPITTELSIIEAVLKAVIQAGAKEVAIAEAAAVPLKRQESYTTRQVFDLVGLTDLAKKYRVELIALDETEVQKLQAPDSVIYKQQRLYSRIFNYNKKISLPVLKTHFETDVTLGIKNWHGVVADEEKFSKFHHHDISQKVVDLAKRIKYDMTVIGGDWGMEGNGPTGGDPVKTEVTIMGWDDVVSVDAVGAFIMGFDPWEVEHLRIAQYDGLGTCDLSRIEVLGEPINKVKMSFRKPSTSLMGVFQNVTVYEGGACRACKARVHWALEKLQRKGMLQRQKIAVIVGRYPYIPEPEEINSPTYVIGDCAISFSRGISQFHGVELFHGCPPCLVPGLVPSYTS